MLLLQTRFNTSTHTVVFILLCMIIFCITNGKYSRVSITVLFVDIIKFNTNNILTIQEKCYVYTLYILEFLMDLYYLFCGDGFLFVFIFIYIFTQFRFCTCVNFVIRGCRFISPLSSRSSTRTYIEDEKKRAS